MLLDDASVALEQGFVDFSISVLQKQFALYAIRVQAPSFKS